MLRESFLADSLLLPVGFFLWSVMETLDRLADNVCVGISHPTCAVVSRFIAAVPATPATLVRSRSFAFSA